MKKPHKSGKELSILSDFFQAKGGTAKTNQHPLRRGGMPNFDRGSNDAQGDIQKDMTKQTDVPMIDLESIIAEEDRRNREHLLATELQRQAEAVQLIRDAGEKWSQMPGQKRKDIEQRACQFLLTMNSTLCFFTVSLRMLAFAPWKDSMVALDVRQAALVAIARGWYVKSVDFSAYPFSRAELALAAGTYLGMITPTISEDATVALRAIVELLPIVCDDFFTSVVLRCPFCQAKASGRAPILSTAVTWKSDEWIDLKTTLKEATPFVSVIPQQWHAPTCNRGDVDSTIEKFGPWIYLELRPYPVLSNEFFPSLSESTSIPLDRSLKEIGLSVAGFVCSHLEAGSNRHYWLVECLHGRLCTAYDSLKGVQRITQELFRSLSVTGLILTTTASTKKPVLRTKDLNTAAGKVSQVARQAKPIQVAGRSASYKQRKSLMPKLKNSGSPGTNLKSFFHDRPGRLWGPSPKDGLPKKGFLRVLPDL